MVIIVLLVVMFQAVATRSKFCQLSDDDDDDDDRKMVICDEKDHDCML